MSSTVLEAKTLDAGYRGQPVIRKINLHVNSGEIVCLLGANGAGKTTLLQTLAGEITAISGEVLLWRQVSHAPLHQRVRQGLAYITDERSLIFSLSTRDNLSLRNNSLSHALKLFPELEALLDRPAGLLSGGEQQMVAVARCLAAKPKLLIVDELSMGLAPQVVDRLLKALREAADNGLAVLLVEQHIAKALNSCDRGYVLSQGEIVLSGDKHMLLKHSAEIEQAYIAKAATTTKQQQTLENNNEDTP